MKDGKLNKKFFSGARANKFGAEAVPNLKYFLNMHKMLYSVIIKKIQRISIISARLKQYKIITN